MKLYVLKVRDEYLSGELESPWDPWYNKEFGYVIRAASELQAREMASDDSGMDWNDKTYTSCERLRNNGKAEIILEDFRAA